MLENTLRSYLAASLLWRLDAETWVCASPDHRKVLKTARQADGRFLEGLAANLEASILRD